MYTKNSDIENTKKRAVENTQDLYDDLGNIQDKMKETRDAITLTARHVKEKAEEVLGQSLDGVKAKSEIYKDKFSSYVEENPFKAVLFAAGAGVIFSFLLRNK